ncbi:TolC family protein [Aliifodinibius sp. S!AR15-10]|uniref:TolC family protein n=1 Tax=Aliifodinibius sp. S!AR15-10 TaxID=2950437 RepID=UPI0028604EB3|nr:TolC family protein [Aliifodinibius sp. S!AR15-10]MDR8390130.1 TolC family protein [Aliifodinibius sp. S!AR15-10]
MKRGIIVVLILGFPLLLKAQTDSVETITLEEAIEIALENNYQLKVAQNNYELSQNQELSEKADYLPSLNANISGNRNVGRTFDQSTGSITTETNNSLRSSLSADIPIFSGFENLHSLKSSQFDKMSSEENLERVRENIIFNTASNYLQFILDKQFLEIDRENLAASQKTLEQVRAQVEVGSRPNVDLYNQEAQVANNELAVVNSENALESSRLQLIQTLQIDPRKEYEFVSPDIDGQTITAPEYDLEELVTTALENRSDLQREKYNIEAIRHQLSATKGSLYPSLSLSGNLSSGYSELQRSSFNDQFFDLNINRSVGLSLNIPIFGNLNRRTNVQSQRISYRNALLNLQDIELQIVQEVNQAYNDYTSYVKQLESSEKALRAAERSYETQRQRYNVGAGTLIELSDANAQYVEAQASRAQALFRLIFQQQLLDYYIGKLNENISLE